MAQYPIPNPQFGIYNNNNFSKQPSATDALTLATGKLYFLQFPNAQSSQTEFLNDIGVSGTSTFEGQVTFNNNVTYNDNIEFNNDVIVDGTATIGGNLLCDTTATISGILTAETGIDISISGGITFPDNSQQTTAFIEANYAQLNTDNTFLAGFLQTFNGGIDMNNSPISNVSLLAIGSSSSTSSTISTNGSNVTIFNNNLGTSGLTGYSFATVPSAIAGLTQAMNILGNGINMYRTLNMNGNTLSGSIIEGTQINGNNFNILSTVGGGPSALNYFSNGILTLNLGATDSFSIANTGTVSANFGSTQITISKLLNLNTNNITNVGAIGGVTGALAINATINMGTSNNLNMNSNNIVSCNSINDVTGQYVTTSTPPDNSITTAIATTGYVDNVISGVALLTKPGGSLQTFTTPINFTSTLQSNSVTVATLNNLPIYTTGISLSVYSPLDPGRCTLSGPTTQETIQTNNSATAYASFLSSPFTFTQNNVGGVPVANGSTITPTTNPVLVLSFSKLPWPNAFGFTPTTGYFNLTAFCTSASGSLSINVPCSFSSTGPTTILYIGASYNSGNGALITLNLSGLGLFVS